MRVKISKPPPPAPTANATGPYPTEIKIVGRPGTGSLPSTIAPPDHPLPPSKAPSQSQAVKSTKFLMWNKLFFSNGFKCKEATKLVKKLFIVRISKQDCFEFKLTYGANFVPLKLPSCFQLVYSNSKYLHFTVIFNTVVIQDYF